MNIYSILQLSSPSRANMRGYARLPRAARPRESRDAVPTACAREVAGKCRAAHGQGVMGRGYGEPVEGQMREDRRPVRFAWRERRYAVIAVQEHWMVNRDWWREPAPVPV